MFGLANIDTTVGPGKTVHFFKGNFPKKVHGFARTGSNPKLIPDSGQSEHFKVMRSGSKRRK